MLTFRLPGFPPRALAAISLLPLTVWICGCSPSSERLAFDLPAGQADLMLMEFAKQAKVEIAYDASVVGGMETNAVRGDFAPLDALRRMLVGTGLVVERDARTGAIAVVEAKARLSDGAAVRRAALATASSTAGERRCSAVAEMAGRACATNCVHLKSACDVFYLKYF